MRYEQGRKKTVIGKMMENDEDRIILDNDDEEDWIL